MLKRILLAFLTVQLLLAGCQQASPTAMVTTPATTDGSAATAVPTGQVFAPAIGGDIYPVPVGSGTSTPAGDLPQSQSQQPKPGYPAPGGTTPASSIPQGDLTFNAADGEPLAGTITGSGSVGVILAHMYGGSRAQWKLLVDELDAESFTVLAFDFRGFGESPAARDLKLLDQDILGAAQLLRSFGIEKIACVGASMGGTACVKAAGETDVAGLVVISSPLVMEKPLEVTQDILMNLAIPKLFIAAKDDNPYDSDVQQMYDWSAEPRQIEILEGNQHGTNLLFGKPAEVVREAIIDFLSTLE